MLVDFLLARITEDEAMVREWPDSVGQPPDGYAFWVDPQGHPIYQPRSRVLAECEAKRRTVNELSGAEFTQTCHPEYEGNNGYVEALRKVLALLALPYADHPDYDESWRP